SRLLSTSSSAGLTPTNPAIRSRISSRIMTPRTRAPVLPPSPAAPPASRHEEKGTAEADPPCARHPREDQGGGLSDGCARAVHAAKGAAPPARSSLRACPLCAVSLIHCAKWSPDRQESPWISLTDDARPVHPGESLSEPHEWNVGAVTDELS